MPSAKRTVLITGASSGIGLETALCFFEHDWNVIATMRNPDQRKTPLHERGLPDLVHLDVTDSVSIHNAVQYALARYERIDVLVNNAGYAVYGPFEATTSDQQMRQYETNVFGLFEVTRALLPVFRRQGNGMLVNVASMGGRIGFPLYSLYNSTKWAIEGFTEALQFELKPLGIRVKIVEPGVIKTDFYERSLDKAGCAELEVAYREIVTRGARRLLSDALRTGAEPSVVASVIYHAATDNSDRLRYVAGNDARLVSLARRLLPDGAFTKLLARIVLD